MLSDGDGRVCPEGIIRSCGSSSNNTTDDGSGRGGCGRGYGQGQYKGCGGQQGHGWHGQ